MNHKTEIMKKILTIVFLTTMVMGTIITFISCSKDYKEEAGIEINPKKIFPSGLPKSVMGMAVQTNEKGQIVSMKSADMSVTFKYVNEKTRSASPSPDVIMTVIGMYKFVYGPPTGNNKSVYNLYLNKDGYIQRCDEIKYYERGKPWVNRMDNFLYDSDGHLIKATIKDGEEIWNWVYEDGDIVRMERMDHGKMDAEPWMVYYTSEKYPFPLDNKKNLMMFNKNIPADLDDLSLAYFAGLLGTPTKHLPVRYTEGTMETSSVWTFNEYGTPISLKVYQGRGHSIVACYSFVW